MTKQIFINLETLEFIIASVKAHKKYDSSLSNEISFTIEKDSISIWNESNYAECVGKHIMSLDLNAKNKLYSFKK